MHPRVEGPNYAHNIFNCTMVTSSNTHAAAPAIYPLFQNTIGRTFTTNFNDLAIGFDQPTGTFILPVGNYRVSVQAYIVTMVGGVLNWGITATIDGVSLDRLGNAVNVATAGQLDTVQCEWYVSVTQPVSNFVVVVSAGLVGTWTWREQQFGTFVDIEVL